MENYKTIVEEIKALAPTQNSYERKSKYSALYKAAKTDEEVLEIAKQEEAEYEQEQENSIKRCVLMHNAEVAYIAEILPKVCAVYQRYAGKNIGKARKDKMLDEIKEITGGEYAFLDNDGLALYHPYSNNRIQLYFVWNSKENKRYAAYNTDGKLNEIKPEMFSYNKQYIEDIPAYIKRKTEQAAKVAELSKQLEQAQRDYNDDLADGFYAAEWGKTNTYQRLYR